MFYGWNTDRPDHNDFLYSAPFEILQSLPYSADLRQNCPEIYDQGQLGSCTANAIAGVIEYDQIKEGIAEYTPSRLFIYYNEREIEGTTQSDSGAAIRDGVKSCAKLGACSEQVLPYEIANFALKPGKICYEEAISHRITSYQRIQQNLTQMKGCIASGYPFVFGFSVYESFESSEVSSNGIVPMPSNNESQLGGHAVSAVGYDDANQWFICRNSWGNGWGDNGYFYMPYQYLLSNGLSSDFWTIRFTK